jgi:hypothetical protein
MSLEFSMNSRDFSMALGMFCPPPRGWSDMVKKIALGSTVLLVVGALGLGVTRGCSPAADVDHQQQGLSDGTDAGAPGITPTTPTVPGMPGTTPTVPGAAPVMPGTTPTLPGAAPVMPGTTPTLPGAAPVMPSTTPTLPGAAPVMPPVPAIQAQDVPQPPIVLNEPEPPTQDPPPPPEAR